MWDPQAYRDTDYGLRDEERFEPEEADADERQLLDRRHVMTVLGPIEPDQLGICQPHEHILRDSSTPEAPDPEHRLDRLDFAAAELEIFFTVGGRSMVDLTTRDQGRNFTGLVALAQRVPVHLIATTALPAATDGTAGPASAADEVIAEIDDGVGPGRVKPGVLTVSASVEMSGDVADQLAGIVSATGVPLFVRDAGPDEVSRSVELASRLSGGETPVIVGGLEPEIEEAVLAHLISAGAFVCFDTIGRNGPEHDAAVARTITSLAEAGFGHSVLISQGLDRATEFVSYGGTPGWGYLLERFTLTLMEFGTSALLARQLLVENPAMALAKCPPSLRK